METIFDFVWKLKKKAARYESVTMVTMIIHVTI